jgi:transposase-like protein
LYGIDPRSHQRSARRPSNRVESNGHVAVGCKYGVSDNAVRKWVRFYERQMEREAEEATASDD